MSKDLPLVSIVTPSFNQGQFIENTILSVKNQDYVNLEHIVIDGGSKDNTLTILKMYEKKYNLKWISKPDRGQSDAVNKGFVMAKGEIIGWLNSDDIYFSRDVISFAYEFFNENPEIDVMYGIGVNISADNRILKVAYPIPWHDFNKLLRRDYIRQPSVFLRKRTVKNFQLNLGIDLPMDYEYWLRLTKNGIKFKYVNKILSGARIHSEAKSNSRRSELKREVGKIRVKYGANFGIKYSIYKWLDYIIYIPFIIKRVLSLLRLYLKPETNLAIPLSSPGSRIRFILKSINLIEDLKNVI